MKIEITDLEVFTRSIKSKDGKDYTFYTQKGWLHNGHSYPVSVTIPVSGVTSGYNLGWYTLASDSFVVDRYENLFIKKRYTLIPMSK